MWIDLFTALALVFIIEGIMPFCNPTGLRKMFILVSGMVEPGTVIMAPDDPVSKLGSHDPPRPDD